MREGEIMEKLILILIVVDVMVQSVLLRQNSKTINKLTARVEELENTK